MAGGRPPKFEDEETLSKSIGAYFDDCAGAKELPTKAGLCLELDISRDTYSEYRKRFPDAIRRADDTIEHAWVQRLAQPGATGAIFYLKNAFKDDYRDRQEMDHTSKGERVAGFNFIPNASGGNADNPANA